jgi:poly(beta-D-mannuronate) lyase
MKHPLLALVLLTTAANASRPKPPAEPPTLHSPWDVSPVALTQAPFTCPTLAPISRDITVTNLHHQHPNLTDADYQAQYPQSSAALADLTRAVVTAADTYRATGSQAAAQCTIALLAAAALHHTMAGNMLTTQAWKDQNRTLRSLAIALLKVRDSGQLSPDDRDLILAWFTDVVQQEREHYDDQVHCTRNACARLGHVGLETAMAAAAIAIAANDHRLYDWALGNYYVAVDHIEDTGFLHYDLEHKYALKFHLESAAALVQLAEFSLANGNDLYPYDDGRLHLLIQTVTHGLLDPTPFANATGRTQTLPKRKLETWQISWASVYDQRFPDPVIDQLLQQVNFKGSDMWGGEPWQLNDQPEDTPSHTDTATANTAPATNHESLTTNH